MHHPSDSVAPPSVAPAPLGFLGGGFDPVHNGHLSIAHDAIAALALQRVYFVPAAHSPLKDDAPHASAADRLEMLRLATAGEPAFGVLDWELQRPPPSYTVDTARMLAQRFPDARRFWIIGADQAAALDRWHRIDELARLIEFIVLARPGHPAPHVPPGIAPGLRWHACPTRLSEASSTEVRARLQQGKPIDFLVPQNVNAFIQQRHLYQNA